MRLFTIAISIMMSHETNEVGGMVAMVFLLVITRWSCGTRRALTACVILSQTHVTASTPLDSWSSSPCGRCARSRCCRGLIHVRGHSLSSDRLRVNRVFIVMFVLIMSDMVVQKSSELMQSSLMLLRVSGLIW